MMHSSRTPLEIVMIVARDANAFFEKSLSG